jgi:hypothetical protein
MLGLLRRRRAGSPARRAGHDMNTLLRFMMFCGSCTRLICRIIWTAPAPASSTR